MSAARGRRGSRPLILILHRLAPSEVHRAAALAGVGIAGLPDFLIEKHIEAGALVPLLTDYSLPDLGIFLVRPPGAFPARKVRALSDILIEYFAHPTRLPDLSPH